MAFGKGDWNITSVKEFYQVTAQTAQDTVLGVWSVPFQSMLHTVYIVAKSLIASDTQDAILHVLVGGVQVGTITIPDGTALGGEVAMVWATVTPTAAYPDMNLDRDTVIEVHLGTAPTDAAAVACDIGIYAVWTGQ